MKLRSVKIFLLPLCLVLMNALLQGGFSFAEQTNSSLRVEQEDRFMVPKEKKREVWDFLYTHYVLDQSELKKWNPDFSSSQADEKFVDVYFDTPHFELLQAESSVRHRKRINLTNPDDRKSGRELLQIKIGDVSENEQERGEYKFDINHFNESSLARGHPVIDIVDSDQQTHFIETLMSNGFDVYEMNPVLTVHDLRKRIYLRRESEDFISISFDDVWSQVLWAKIDFLEIEVELNEVTFTRADEEKKKYMEETAKRISAQIQEKFPFIKRDLTPKYNKVFSRLEGKLPFFRFLIKINLHRPENWLVVLSLLVAVALAGNFLLKGKMKK